MKKILIAVATLLLASPALAVEPIPGSITYGGQPRTKLKKAPIGGPVVHRFESGGIEYEERYIIQPDRSLRLVSRSRGTMH
jgi:hypothetical protein